jgi:hypothetical protein
MNSLKDKYTLYRFGYYKNHHGIIRRYLSHAKEWAAHLENCQRYIQDWAKRQSARDVIILGSGWLLDVPVDELLEKFEQVFLVDLVHPRQVQRKFENKAGLHFIQADITGGLINKSGQARKALEGHADWPRPEYEFLNELEPSRNALISLNILSQLAFPITTFMKRAYKIKPGQETLANKYIQQQHLDLLKKYPSCLISDHEEIILKDRGNEKIINPLLNVNWPNGQHPESWTWDFDTRKTYYPDARRYLKVKACSFWPGI